MEILEKAEKYIAQNKFNSYYIGACVSGKMQVKALQPANRLNCIYSVSKNFIATAIAMLEFRGCLTVNDLAKNYLSQYFCGITADEKWNYVTIGNLLSHCWGQENGDFFEADRYRHGDDWARFILSEKLPLELGKEMRYSNASYYLLSLIVEKVSGRRAFDFLAENLFNPMHFEGYASGLCPQGHTVGATEMFFRTEDLLKFGLLYLNKGVYEGKRFFSDDWADRASTPVAHNGKLFYGYGFWKREKDSSVYFASGAHGQLVVIDGKKQRVFVVQGYENFDDAAFVETII